jgi:hypothetical protein
METNSQSSEGFIRINDSDILIEEESQEFQEFKDEVVIPYFKDIYKVRRN